MRISWSAFPIRVSARRWATPKRAEMCIRDRGSETQVSVQKLPTDGYTDTASIMAFGYNPFIASWSPYHGAAYALSLIHI